MCTLHVCVCVCACVRACVRVYLCLYVCISLCVCVSVSMRACVYSHQYVSLWLCPHHRGQLFFSGSLSLQIFMQTKEERLKNQQREYEAQQQYRQHLQVQPGCVVMFQQYRQESVAWNYENSYLWFDIWIHVRTKPTPHNLPYFRSKAQCATIRIQAHLQF